MKQLIGPAWMAGGVVLGALVTTILLGAVPLPVGPKHSPLLQRLPTSVLARVLIAREARMIVADKRDSHGLWDGASLYGRPDAASASLCRVRVYSFDNYSRMRDRESGVPAEVRDSYGIWADPADESNRAAGSQYAGCAAYRDFDHLIGGEAHEIIPAIELAALARDAARKERVTFNLSCMSRRDDRKGAPCDGSAYLRSLDLKKIQWVEFIGDSVLNSPRQFRITIQDGDIHGHPLITLLTITSRPNERRRDPGLSSVALEQDAY
ncbi:hypothetical protein [Brevundimonas sp.]|uniref:hypothetical protein n=1 Tax=Brevundimonas sp. TaxID=1871086 RepID=UPI002D743A43|nr:hypothetical protein [Brevundimonas sp.]HYC68451.1 hypothetical protein [Brevundimonas sp.]